MHRPLPRSLTAAHAACLGCTAPSGCEEELKIWQNGVLSACTSLAVGVNRLLLCTWELLAPVQGAVLMGG